MKKLWAILLTLALMLSCCAFASADSVASDELIAAAQAEGELVVYGSCGRTLPRRRRQAF